MKKQIIAVSVIFLFINLSSIPCIDAKLHIDNNLIEITTDFYDIDDVTPCTICLTQEEVYELENYIDIFKNKLETVERQVEIIELFNDVIVKFDEYGLLGQMSVEQAQNLVIGKHHILQEMNYLEESHIQFQEESGDVENLLCLITGQTTKTFFQTPLSTIQHIHMFTLAEISVIPLFIWYISLRMGLSIISAVFLIIVDFLIRYFQLLRIPFEFSMYKIPIIFGSNIWYAESKGWVKTFGLRGIEEGYGTLIGKLPVKGFFKNKFKAWIYGDTEPDEPCIGVKGFTGFKLNVDMESFETFYIGSALKVSINEK